ncbi:hypothetical protein AB0X41_03865 [Lapidilactobacillus dextrinicus]
MTTNGLFLMAIGFAMIMMSPANHDINQIRLGIMTLGFVFVALGFYFYRRGRKNDKAQKNKKPTDDSIETTKKVTKK